MTFTRFNSHLRRHGFYFTYFRTWDKYTVWLTYVVEIDFSRRNSHLGVAYILVGFLASLTGSNSTLNFTLLCIWVPCLHSLMLACVMTEFSIRKADTAAPQDSLCTTGYGNFWRGFVNSLTSRCTQRIVHDIQHFVQI